MCDTDFAGVITLYTGNTDPQFGVVAIFAGLLHLFASFHAFLENSRIDQRRKDFLWRSFVFVCRLNLHPRIRNRYFADPAHHGRASRRHAHSPTRPLAHSHSSPANRPPQRSFGLYPAQVPPKISPSLTFTHLTHPHLPSPA